MGALESRSIQLTAVPKKEVQLSSCALCSADDVIQELALAGLVEDPERDLGHI